MIYLNAFLFAGIACLLAQIILDNTKLTPGHVTSLFTILGAFFGFLGLYDKFISFAGGGATTIISNFGYVLYKGAYLGFQEQGILGMISVLRDLHIPDNTILEKLQEKFLFSKEEAQEYLNH